MPLACIFLTFYFYFWCAEGDCAGAERIKATKQNPARVPFLSQPTNCIITLPDQSAISEQGMQFLKSAPLDIIFYSTE
ncbi:hypothetical protein DKM28_13440 [Methanosarcina mazei]|uniref:Uncharacterized protein n=1 Tax=Methanosarcina mazei TaxID=2209 RepID=A0A4P8R7H6_METMZ|nr:hypothetical protein DKM28_13440 [Methanosarcina mazei]